VFDELKRIRRAGDSAFNYHGGRSIPVAVLLILVVVLSAGSGLYAGASYFPQQAPNLTITTTIYTTTTSWTTSTIWSTLTSVVYGVWTTVQYTTSTSTITVTGNPHIKAVITNNGGTNSFTLKVFTTSNTLVCKQSASINMGSTVTLDCEVTPGTYVVRVFYAVFTKIYGPMTVTVPPDAVIPITYP
jgi:hypothetical protein